MVIQILLLLLSAKVQSFWQLPRTSPYLFNNLLNKNRPQPSQLRAAHKSYNLYDKKTN
jgi:hypothetical protein